MAAVGNVKIMRLNWTQGPMLIFDLTDVAMQRALKLLARQKKEKRNVECVQN